MVSQSRSTVGYPAGCDHTRGHGQPELEQPAQRDALEDDAGRSRSTRPSHHHPVTSSSTANSEELTALAGLRPVPPVDALVDLVEVVGAADRPGEEGQREEEVDDQELEEVDRDRQDHLVLEGGEAQVERRAVEPVAEHVDDPADAGLAVAQPGVGAVGHVTDPVDAEADDQPGQLLVPQPHQAQRERRDRAHEGDDGGPGPETLHGRVGVGGAGRVRHGRTLPGRTDRPAHHGGAAVVGGRHSAGSARVSARGRRR